MRKTGNKWRTEKCGRCGEAHEGYSGKLDADGVEYVVCGTMNKRMDVRPSKGTTLRDKRYGTNGFYATGWVSSTGELSPCNPWSDAPGHVVPLHDFTGDVDTWAYMAEPCSQCGSDFTHGRIRTTTLACAVAAIDAHGYRHYHEDTNNFSAEVACPKGHCVEVYESQAACWCGWRRRDSNVPE